MSLLKRIEQGQAKEEGAEIPARRVSLPARNNLNDIKIRVQNRLLAELDPNMDITNTDEVRQVIEELFDKILDEDGIIL